MHQSSQNVVHNTEVLVPCELSLYIHKILVHSVEPSRDQFTDMYTDERRRLEKSARIIDDTKNARSQSPYCCRVVSPKQRG
jgi:hypothetical protein